MKALIDTEASDLDLSCAVNTKGVFFGMKHPNPANAFAGKRGSPQFFVDGRDRGAPKLAAYAAAKHAVVGLTKTAVVEYGRRGIRVNVVCTFFSSTPMVTEGDLGAQLEFLAQGLPMKRLGRAEEVVAAMLTLCAKENVYLAGQAVTLDGGVSAF